MMADQQRPAETDTAPLRLLRALVQRAPIGMAMLDTSFRYTLINDTLAALNGKPVDAHIGRSVQEIIPHLWATFLPIYERVLRERQPVTGIELARREGNRPDGAEMTWLTSYFPAVDDAGALIGIGVIATNVTDRKRAELELLRLSEHQRAILSAMPDVIFELGADGTHLGFHAPAADTLLLRPEEFLGRRVREVLPETVARTYEDAIVATLAGSPMQVFEYELHFPTGTRAFDARMVRKSESIVLVVVRDITERRRLEEQFRHAQKMEAVGRLAGGVAHDFNNILTVINGCTAMALEEGVPPAATELLEEVSRAGQRAATLTRQLLLFSRQQVLDPRVTDLNAVVEETERMLRRLIDDDVRLTLDLAPDLPSVRIDRGLLEQVLVNLVVNARDAMPPEGGDVVIRTTTITEGGGIATPVGEYAVLIVRDTGVGMDDETRARIFEPFFTTKEIGRGTGLGLSVVFGVVKESGGHIRVQTEPGRGTTFELLFPAVAKRASVRSIRDLSSDTMPCGSETILLVEDDEAVAAMTARILHMCEYHVLQARDGREAIDVLAAYTGPVALLLSDVVIPHLSGRELAAEVERMRPGIRVLFMSGYTDDEVLRRGVLSSEVAFIQKPFTPQALAQRIRQELDRA
jgi:PAS domain S-box-containing protein